MKHIIDRRTFVRHAATAGAGLVLAAKLGSRARAATPPPANGRLRIAVAGTNSRGLAHVELFGGVSTRSATASH